MTIFFNALHSPLGAHSSFTLGCLGKNGGLGLELGGPADENVYIGLETRAGGKYEALPFYAGAEDPSLQFDHAKKGSAKPSLLRPFNLRGIKRDFGLGSDTWRAGDLTFRILSPVEAAPDPERANGAALRGAYCPAVLAELTVDNRQGRRPRRAFFGYSPNSAGDCTRAVELSGGGVGVARGQATGIFCAEPGVRAATHFSAEAILREPHEFNLRFGLGGTGLLLFEVPAGKLRTFTCAVAFFRGGIVTTGWPTSYLYYRYFKSLEAVASYALDYAPAFRARAEASERLLPAGKLRPAQRWQLIQAIRSYQGSTQLLDRAGQPVWVVNEGEYRMLNTFDLTVDQLFYEMKLNPWTVRNELDLFVSRYSYRDRTHFPGRTELHSGGLSFTHDMGQKNHFSPPGRSAYELTGLDGCFSHMTYEQLVNWVLCAAVYVQGSGDRAWLRRNRPILRQCLRSMVSRDHPEERRRRGVMGLDSSRTGAGAEITTYDSLDASLGQARNNLYLAVKGWAAYLALARLLADQRPAADAARAERQAGRAAATIAGQLNSAGYIPAILEEGSESRIISAVEGLVFPYILEMPEALASDGPHGELIRALRTHLSTILKPGVCLYPDGGWKLSSSADNSWLSKIYLCQFVARRILGLKGALVAQRADQAHQAWLLKAENLRFAFSDQMTSGVARGSKYYPLGVTAILWLEE